MSTSRAPDPDAVDDFMRQYLAKVMRIADAGNIDAGKRCLRVGADIIRLLAPEMARYEPLMVWLAERIEAAAENPAKAGVELRIVRRKGTPPKSADDMHARLRMEAVKVAAVLAVIDAMKGGARTKLGRRAEKTAFEVARDVVAKKHGVRPSPDTIRHWYDERRSLLPVKRRVGPVK